MSIYIDSILTDDSELENRVLAYGPGDGLNRWLVTVEDATSISSYGIREGVASFPEAVDRNDLVAKANEYLASSKDPIEEISFTYYFDSGVVREDLEYKGQIVEYNGEPVTVFNGGNANSLKRGDTVRVVSRELELSFTGVVDELDWSPGQVSVRLGKPSYNLLEVLRGPERSEERKRAALGLPVPIGFRPATAAPGVIVKLNPYTNSRAVGVEVYGSTIPGFEADQSTLLVKGGGTRFEFPKFTPGTIYYFRARSYDADGLFSDFTEERSAISGAFDGGTIGEGTISDLTPFASALRPPRNVASLPSLPDPDYADGDLVVYDDGSGARIYENQSGSWVQLTAGGLEGRTIAHQVVAGQVVAGAISADEIAAGAITTGKLAAGHVIIDDGPDSDNIPDRIRVNTTSGGGGIDRAIMGYINGKPGVPSGVDWGFWAEYGSGIFIPGALKIDSISGGARTGVSMAYWPSGTFGDVNTAGEIVITTQGSYTVEAGRTRYWITIPISVTTGTDNIEFEGIQVASNGYSKLGPGPAMGFASFIHPISVRGRYRTTIPSDTYKPSISFVNIQLSSYE